MLWVANLPTPTGGSLVRRTYAGIRRTIGTAQTGKALAVVKDLKRINNKPSIKPPGPAPTMQQSVVEVFIVRHARPRFARCREHLCPTSGRMSGHQNRAFVLTPGDRAGPWLVP